MATAIAVLAMCIVVIKNVDTESTATKTVTARSASWSGLTESTAAKTVEARGASWSDLVVALPSGFKYASGPVVAVDGKDKATVLWTVSDGSQSRVEYRPFALDGKLGPTGTLDVAKGKVRLVDPQMTVDASGTLTVAWVRKLGNKKTLLSRRIAPDGTLGHVTVVAKGHIFRAVLAGSSNGVSMFVWERWRKYNGKKHLLIESRRLTSSGTLGYTLLLESDSNLGFSCGRYCSTHRLQDVAMSDRGDALVAWAVDLRPTDRQMRKIVVGHISATGRLESAQTVISNRILTGEAILALNGKGDGAGCLDGG